MENKTDNKKNVSVSEMRKNEQNKSMFELVADELGAAVFEWNLQTGEFRSSAEYQKYTFSSVSTEDILHNTGPKDVVHPDDMAELKKFFDQTDSKHGRAEVVLRLKLHTGEYHWCRMIGLYYKDENGIPCRTVGIIIDINGEHEEREVLKRNYEEQVRYNRMLSSASVGSSMVNLTKNIITLQNTEENEIHTIITQQTPQQGFEAMYSCIPDLEVRKKYEVIFDTQTIIAEFDKGVLHKNIIHPFMTFDCWYDSGYDAVKNPTNGDLEVYCYANDVSDEVLRHDVNTILMSHSYEEVMIINSESGEPRPLIEVDAGSVFFEQKAVGNYEEGVRKYMLRHSADEHPEKIAESVSLKAVKKALETKETYSVAYTVYDEEHNLKHKTVSFTYLNQYKNHILCTVQNITSAFKKENQQRAALENALNEMNKASQAKTEFYSRMSHDMRTPMNGILGLANLSEDETDIAVLKSNIKKMEQSGQYLLGLINDTLDFQKMESGRLVLHPEIVSTRDLVANVLTMIRMEAQKKNICFKTMNKSADLDCLVKVDPMRMKQIFFNLLSNAVKFTQPGGTIEVCFQCTGHTGHVAHDIITITDTGIGMSRDFLENRIFQPFSQERSEIVANYAGSGLGLSIVKQLVELMNGEISVESELGEGTKFTIKIDFERAEEPEVQKHNQQAEMEKRQIEQILKGKSILLAEDHPLNAEIAMKLLEKVGCKIDWVKDGRECFDCFSTSPVNRYDAILMDIRMPNVDGLTATRLIRSSTREDAGTLPIIAMTANAYDTDIENCLSAGMTAHIAKPIEPAKLYSELAKQIEHIKEE